MEGRFGDIVLTARYFYVTALVHLTKDFDDLIYSVSFLFHVSGRVLARQSLIFNGPVCGGQVITTLLDPVTYSREDLAELYYRRWSVELYFRNIKTTMGMDNLRGKSP